MCLGAAARARAGRRRGRLRLRRRRRSRSRRRSSAGRRSRASTARRSAIEVARANAERNGVDGRRSRTPTRGRRAADLASCCWPTRRRPCTRASPRRVTPQVRHVIVSGIVEGELRGRASSGYARGRPRRRAQGMARRTRGSRCGWSAGWLSPLDPDAAARAAPRSASSPAALDGGGLLISASRLVEFNCRAAILLAPGLFRLDLTPQQETLGARPAPARRPRACDWAAEEASWDGYREQSSRERRSSCAGVFDLPGDPLLAWIHVLSFTDRDAGPCTSWPRPRSSARRRERSTPRRCWTGTSACGGRCRGARPATRTRCSSRR